MQKGKLTVDVVIEYVSRDDLPTCTNFAILQMRAHGADADLLPELGRIKHFDVSLVVTTETMVNLIKS